jgi:hypothetical protein
MTIHVHSRSSFIVEPQTSMSYSLCFCDTCNIRDLIIGITIPSLILLPILPFTRSVIFHHRDLDTCYNISYNLAEWAQSISFHHAKEQILLLVHTPQPIPLAYLKTPFQSPFTKWRLMPSEQPHDIVIRCDLTIWEFRLECLLLSQHEHRGMNVLHTKVGYVHHGICLMTWSSLSIEHKCHTIQKLIISWLMS